jgi:dTDP-glucose pyrophosphorylase
MIVIIPLGGTGERFKKLGYTNPKALIEVEQTPILFHLLDKVFPIRFMKNVLKFYNYFLDDNFFEDI